MKILLEMLCWSGAKRLDLKSNEVNRTFQQPHYNILTLTFYETKKHTLVFSDGIMDSQHQEKTPEIYLPCLSACWQAVLDRALVMLFCN